MKVAVTGATGTVGREVVRRLAARGDEVTVLSRDAARARERLAGVEAVEWPEPQREAAPAAALAGRDGVINLLGEPLDKRWTEPVKREIRDSRVLGTRNLVAGIEAAEPRPRVLVSQSASGYYGPRGDERVDESQPAAADFLARVCVEWEGAAREAEALGLRVVTTRAGVVLSPEGGALKRMRLPFSLGLGGPVAGGRQYMPWVTVGDTAAALIHLLDDDSAAGAYNVSAPEPATNEQFSKALGRALRRPAVAPMPAVAMRILFGEMASVVTTGVRMVPARLAESGFEFEQPDLDAALHDLVR